MTFGRLSRTLALFASLCFFAVSSAKASENTGRIPVILDTDFGDDIDDTWALGLLLKSPELDLKLVVGDYGRAQYRSRLIAKFLQTVGRADIPVGVGLDLKPDGQGAQKGWLGDYDIASYPGKVLTNGVQAIIDVIMQSKEPVTVIGIGSLPNIAAALERRPEIATRARFVGMQGSVRIGYGGKKQPDPEWNVKCDPKACQKAFTAPWEMTITPLDTCDQINITGERYNKILNSPDIVARTIIANYRAWSTDKDTTSTVAELRSSTLFDTVAVYLAFNHDLCKMERLGIRIDDKGFTLIDNKAKLVNVATEWKDLEGFRDLLVQRLTANTK